jgi:hypothetical protein
VQGFAGGALLLGGRSFGSTSSPAGQVLSGNSFDLTIDTMPVNLTGASRTAVVVNGQLPGPILRMRQGDTVTIRVTNRLREATSIHWHGIILPADMDGVPGLSFDGIRPGTTFTYRYKVNQSGTYWYHSHSRFQEQIGLYGALVVDRRGGERHAADREHVLLLTDWTDHDPEHIYATLKRQSDYYNFNKRTVADFFDDVGSKGWSATLADRRMWGSMRMNPSDLADVGGYAYTYLMNGATPAGNWTGTFTPGERVRLRIINGSSMSFFDLRIPGLKLTVVAADGQDVDDVGCVLDVGGQQDRRHDHDRDDDHGYAERAPGPVHLALQRRPLLLRAAEQERDAPHLRGHAGRRHDRAAAVNLDQVIGSQNLGVVVRSRGRISRRFVRGRWGARGDHGFFSPVGAGAAAAVASAPSLPFFSCRISVRLGPRVVR